MTKRTELGRDISALRDEIKTKTAEEARLRDEADTLVSSIRESGTDPLKDADAFTKVDEAYKLADAVREEAADLGRRLTRALEIAGERQGDEPGERARERLTVSALAQRFVDSDAVKQLVASGALENSQARINTQPIEVASRAEALAMLFLAAADDHSPLVPEDQQLFPPVPIPSRQVRLIDMITRTTTNREAVEYTVQVLKQDAVAGKAYGDLSPQSHYLWERRLANVRRRTHHVVATKGNLADQGELDGLLRGELIDGSRRELEAQCLNGNGEGEDFDGILNTEGIAEVTMGLGHEDESEHDAIHRGITAVRLALEDDITGIGIHPTPFERVVLSKDNEGRYMHGPPPSLTQPRTIWGYPAVVSTVFPQDGAVPAHFARAATLWLRTGLALVASDSPGNFFLEGLVAIMAELRAAFAVTQPKAVAVVDGLAPAGS